VKAPDRADTKNVILLFEVQPLRKVLFVCNWNACRSPMAEAIARYRMRQDVTTGSSSGVSPLGFIPDLTKVDSNDECATDGWR